MQRKTQFQVQRILYIVLLCGLSFVLISPFIIPIILAATIALALFPLQRKLEMKNWNRKHAAALLTTGFTFAIFLPFLSFLTKGTLLVTEQLRKFSVNERLKDQGMQKLVQTLRHDIISTVRSYISDFGFADFLTEEKISAYLQDANMFLLEFFQNFASNIPMVTLFLLVMIFCTYSFLKNTESIRYFFQEIFGFSNRKMDQLVWIFIRDARQVYLSNIVTGAVQSILVATGVYFVTEADWFLVFFVTLIFSFIPVIGAAPMAFLFALVSFIQGNPSGAIILGVLGIFTGIIDNFLRPWLASFGQSRVPPIVSFICVVGGALLLGFPGLFIGLLAGAITYDTIPIFWEELGKPTFFSSLGKTSEPPRVEQ